jgi:GTP cyclohydrolase II
MGFIDPSWVEGSSAQQVSAWFKFRERKRTLGFCNTCRNPGFLQSLVHVPVVRPASVTKDLHNDVPDRLTQKKNSSEDTGHSLICELDELVGALRHLVRPRVPARGRSRCGKARETQQGFKNPNGMFDDSPSHRLLPHDDLTCILGCSSRERITADGFTYNVRVSTEHTVRKLAEADFPARWGHFRIMGFEGLFHGDRRAEEAVALVMGDIHSAPPLVRIHSQCLTGDVFGSQRCDCRQQLEMALSMIAQAGAGVLVYELQEGRGIGLMPKLQAYELQDKGLDTVEANEELGFKADHRGFQLPAEVLKALGLKAVRLLSNNPQKLAALEAAGVKVIERVPCEVEPHAASERYLNTKKEKMGHLFTGR